MKPFPVIIAGPSGVGKSTIIRSIITEIPELKPFKTITTRPRRSNQEYRYSFINVDQFQGLIEKGELIEWAEVHGNFYGGLKKDVLEILNLGKFPIPINAVDVQGVKTYRQAFPNLLSIFISYGSLDELPDRIRATRPDATEEDIRTRMISAQKEMEAAKDFDFVVANPEGQLKQTLAKVRDIIKKRIRG